MDHMHHKNGFTLVEAIIALVVFAGVVIPLALFIGKRETSIRDRDIITAISILEQESRLAQFDPQSIVPIKIRKVGGEGWRVECSAQGSDLQLCTMKALKNGKSVSMVKFYNAANTSRGP
jgi:prepilin-type N-terminal cleavage/methylation domain-containing protein